MGCHPGENGIYMMQTTHLNENELKGLADFVAEHPDQGVILISNYGSGIGTNHDALTPKQYYELYDKYGKDIPYGEYHKVSKDITDYESW